MIPQIYSMHPDHENNTQHASYTGLHALDTYGYVCVCVCWLTHFIRDVAVIYTVKKNHYSTLAVHYAHRPRSRTSENIFPAIHRMERRQISTHQGRTYSMTRMSQFDALSAFFIVVSTLVDSNPTCAQAESLLVHLAVSLGSWHVAQTRPRESRETRRAV